MKWKHCLNNEPLFKQYKPNPWPSVPALARQKLDNATERKPGLGQGNPCLKRKFLYYQVAHFQGHNPEILANLLVPQNLIQI